jgi:hypothetical protein
VLRVFKCAVVVRVFIAREAYRASVFTTNLNWVNAFNSKTVSEVMVVNAFGDLTPEEFTRGRIGGLVADSYDVAVTAPDVGVLDVNYVKRRLRGDMVSLAPGNDNLARATLLSDRAPVVEGYTQFATRESREPAASIGAYALLPGRYAHTLTQMYMCVCTCVCVCACV